jgi:Asp-tRNA(Asn)/Glu-tRNA(Gln) amidotransferase A subunit family amidase
MSGAERLTATEAATRLSVGTLTAERLVRDCLERAHARAEVKAWVWLDPKHAWAQARAVDRAGRPGLLKGVPVGVKDVIDTVDMPTQHGSPIYRGHRPFADAACVALIRASGGVKSFSSRFESCSILIACCSCGVMTNACDWRSSSRCEIPVLFTFRSVRSGL